MDRKKIILHLFPDGYKQDAYAMDIIDKQKGGKGEFYRSCFLAGLALSKVDNRLPAVLANVLDETVDIDTLINALKLLNLTRDIENGADEVDPKKITGEATQKARSMFLGD